MTDTKALLVLLLAALLGRFITPPSLSGAATRVLNARWFPVFIGLLTAVFMAWLWGGLDQVAVVHDEAAYLLQARIYAGGHWTAPGLPLPEFFEQYHVFVTPILTPKYPPGHALILVPGIWFEYEIVVQGDDYTVFLTNTQTGERRQTTSFRNSDAERGRSPGFVGVQAYSGNTVAWRHIRIKA